MKSARDSSWNAVWRLTLAGVTWVAAVFMVRSGTLAAWSSSRRPGATPDDAVAVLAGSVALLLLGWLGLAAALAALAATLPRGTQAAQAARRFGDRITPAVLRRGLAVLIGAALLGGVAPADAATPGRAAPGRAVAAATATAIPGAGPGTRPGPDPGTRLETGLATGPATGLDPGWGSTPAPAPGSAAGSAAIAGPVPAQARTSLRSGIPDLDPGWGPRSRMRAGAQPETSVVVRRGDTLWDIAARHLGPAATDAQIAQVWPAWFTANRDLIGPDPDRLRPGQRLAPPASAPGGSA